ncbi:MAG: type II toxin-antitoxin system VapC family toxin [Streptosporangiales bacterium]
MATERHLRSVPPLADTMTLVDSSVLIDVLTQDRVWAGWSEQALADARDRGRLVINPIVYAEVSTGFVSVEDLDAAVSAEDFAREPLPYPAGFLAGRAFLSYRRRGGQKRSPLPDFYIGAHAAVRRYRLLTRDDGRCVAYFPTVEVISPRSGPAPA